MKDQYFGDINDYRKYGLLRCIANATSLRIGIAWMLTPDDGGPDGSKVSYLRNDARWVKHDPDLHRWLQATLAHQDRRAVSMISRSDIIRNATYFVEYVPDRGDQRDSWFNSLRSALNQCDLIFLDPDNGLEVRSKPAGRKNSSKYLQWQEVKNLLEDGKSLLIYQHFPRENRAAFLRRTSMDLQQMAPKSVVTVLRTAHVAFVLVEQPFHGRIANAINDALRTRWQGQIDPWIDPSAQ